MSAHVLKLRAATGQGRLGATACSYTHNGMLYTDIYTSHTIGLHIPCMHMRSYHICFVHMIIFV